MRRVALWVAAVVVIGFGLPAHADDDLRARRMKARVLKKGKLAQLKARKVKVAGNKTMTIDAIANKALRKHRDMAAKLRKARRGLLSDPTTSEEAIETADATVLVATVKATVTDPGVVAGEVPELADLRRRRRVKLRARRLRGKARQNFERLKARLKNEPANHPLRKAMEKGDDALLEAIARGEGEVEITTTVAVPKEGPEIVNGKLEVPAFDPFGGFEYSQARRAIQLPAGKTARLPLDTVIRAIEKDDPAPEPITDRSGPVTNVHKTVLGRTVKGGWEWEKKWTFSVATVKISAGLSYGLGIRIPLRIKAKVKPGGVERTAVNDIDRDLTVEITPKIFNADEDFYREAGIAPGDRVQGKELVLNAQLYFNVTGKADLYVAEPKISFGKSFGIVEDQHFKPPFGNCSSSSRCGFDIWLDPHLTQTTFNAGAVRGDASLGFNVTGSGELLMDVQTWIDDKERFSKHATKNRKTHSVSFNKEKTKTFKAEIKKMVRSGTKRYGYRLSNFEYQWQMSVVPALKAGVTVDLGVWDHRFNIGPFYFDFIELPLGRADFRAHDGAKKIFKRAKAGKVKFTRVDR
jgi:hypothetical protein